MRPAAAVAILLATVTAEAAPVAATRVVVDKSDRTMQVFSADVVLVQMAVALGRNEGAKQCEGDAKTPEGHYVVSGRKADSQYHRALRLSYPAPGDRARAKSLGCKPGGDIMIHGLRNGVGWIGRLHRLGNWTLGCVAVTNAEIEVLWELVPDGTPVEIRA